MALGQADAARVKSLLADLPVAQKYPNFFRDIVVYLDRQDVPAGQTIFDPSQPVGDLYMFGEGKVIQTLGTSGQLWFQKDMAPGEFFGQRALFSGQHQTQAVAQAPSVLYRMNAPSLRALLDRYPEFQEALLKEDVATRLRSIPVFEPLRDADIRWLAELVRLVPISQDQQVSINAEPGLWVIDWGQIAVEGPAAVAGWASLPQPAGSPPPQNQSWRLTAGNFFTALQPGMAFGGACAVTKARAEVPSRLFYLADRHFNRLLAAFPEIRPIVSAPQDIAGTLSHVPQLNGQGMTARHFRSLAQIAAWVFVPANQNISTQGSVGYSFVTLLKGAILISAVDDRGHLRPVHMLQQPGESYGLTSLLKSMPRDATARAVTGKVQSTPTPLPGAEILNIDRRDLEYTFATRPDLWHPGVFLFDQFVQTTQQRRRFDWLEEGEYVIWDARPHWLWIAFPLIMEISILLAVLAGASLLLGVMGVTLRNILYVDLALAALLWGPIFWYTWVNYRDDNYILTPRRVTRRLRQLPYREQRISAPLTMVQDVSTNANLWGRLFNYGNLTVRTAAKVGSIDFRHVPDPDWAQSTILATKAQALIASRGYTKERLRRHLIDDLHLALPVQDVDSMRALGADLPTPTIRRGLQRVLPRRPRRPRVLPVRRKGAPGWFRNLLAPLPESWRNVLLGPPAKSSPAPQPLSGEVVWRKHWINFLLRAGPALLATIFVLLLGIVMFTYGGFGTYQGSADLIWVAAMAGTAFWLWYRAVDYWNDQYIVTDDKVIDIEKKPLALSTRQRESSLEVIQTVDSDQPTLWSRIFGYGNVHIRTAASDEGFDFVWVPSPMVVQKIVFQKWDAYRRRQEERQVEERRRSMAEGLQVYHELWEESQQTGRRPTP